MEVMKIVNSNCIDTAEHKENQKVFEILADTEMQLFYAHTQNPDNEEITKAWKNLKNLFENFAKATNCCNE